MAKVFWVNQGGTYLEEKAANLLWAPERTLNGTKLVHWETMGDIQPGDVIFNYAKSHLRGHAIALSASVSMERPYSTGKNYSPLQGGRAVFCAYQTARAPIPLAVVTANTELKLELQSGRNAALDVNGDVAQKYLCEISTAAGGMLAKLSDFNIDDSVAGPQVLPITTVTRLVDARLGQGKFRDDLLSRFNGECAVTRLAIPTLLRASHIKSWMSSNNEERLDPDNGLLLAAGVDAAFDRGYIAFDRGGILLSKPSLSIHERVALGIPVSPFQLSSSHLSPARHRFLAAHRTRFGF